MRFLRSWFKKSKPKFRYSPSLDRQLRLNNVNMSYADYLRSDMWRWKRNKLFAMRGRKCEKCGETKLLHIHHLTYERLGHERFTDLMILCSNCHKKVHKKT